jgi:TonB family protein
MMRRVFLVLLLLPGLLRAEDDKPKFRALARIEETPSNRTPRTTIAPVYPKRARRDRIEGEAVVCFTIDARGKIRKPRVRESTHKLFRKAALKAIRRSGFEPAGPHQVQVTRACRTYRFLLEPVAGLAVATPID